MPRFVELLIIVWVSLPRKLPRRATTRRDDWADGVPARAVVAVFVAMRAVFAARGTTRRDVDKGVVFTTVSIKLEFCDGVMPGFRLVRIWLFMYGYI